MSFLADLFTKIINLPHELWKHSNENSGIGASEFEQGVEHFWRKVSIVGGLIVGAIYLAWKFFFAT